ncbi:MAG: hypothetical protein AAB706_00595 [Patescibacteria group bacterium]
MTNKSLSEKKIASPLFEKGVYCFSPVDVRSAVQRLFKFVKEDHELWDDHADYNDDGELWRKKKILEKIEEIFGSSANDD